LIFFGIILWKHDQPARCSISITHFLCFNYGGEFSYCISERANLSYRTNLRSFISLFHGLFSNLLGGFVLASEDFYTKVSNPSCSKTHIDTAEGWLYLASVLDLYSRRVVGWAMADHLQTSLLESALRMALLGRLPKAGLLHHSDQGSQYTSLAYQEYLSSHRCQVSMSRADNCYDNSVMESFFSILRAECAFTQFATRAQARTRIFEYIEAWYNRQRAFAGQSFELPMLALYCLGMRKEVVDEIGNLDESFGLGMFEDDDYSLRVRKAGYKVLCAQDVFIHHWAKQSFSKLEKEVFDRLFDENRRKFEEKWDVEWKVYNSSIKFDYKS
jgi:putative transposase